MSILGALAAVIGVFLGLSNVPQAFKIFQTKSARDISLLTYLIVEIGSIVWILYGIEIHSIPVIIPNVLGVFSTTLVLVGYLKYHKRRRT